MATFDQIERSVQDGTVVELYDVVAPVKSWRLTSARVNTTYLANVYTAVAAARSSVVIVDFSTNQNELVLQIPASHEIAQTYVAGVPPRDLRVTVTRFHVSWGVALQWWDGYVSSISFGGQGGNAGGGSGSQRVASLRVPSGMNDALATDVPSVVAQRTCNHVLYDPRCTMNPASFTVAANVTSVSADGRTIGSSSAVPAAIGGVDWSFTGYVEVPSIGEKRTITQQISTTSFKLQAPFPAGSISVGTPINVVGGCTKTMDQCDLKFHNGINHAGAPYMPTSNIFYVGLRQALYQY